MIIACWVMSEFRIIICMQIEWRKPHFLINTKMWQNVGLHTAHEHMKRRRSCTCVLLPPTPNKGKREKKTTHTYVVLEKHQKCLFISLIKILFVLRARVLFASVCMWLTFCHLCSSSTVRVNEWASEWVRECGFVLYFFFMTFSFAVSLSARADCYSNMKV